MRALLLITLIAAAAGCGSDTVPFFPVDGSGLDGSGTGGGGGAACTPGTLACAGGDVARCGDDGTLEIVSCGEEECVEGPDGPACTSRICTVGETGCLDAVTAFECAPDGSFRIPLSCSAGERCRDGVCDADTGEACTPGETFCEGDDLVACTATGTPGSRVRCADVGGCADAAFGCTCSGGRCTERACEPNVSVCEGDGVRTCAADGSALGAVEPCDDGETCEGGACSGAGCSEGDTRCNGTVRLRCVDGRWSPTDCADDGDACVDTDGEARCVEPICTPGEQICDGNDLVTCSADGTDLSRRACGAGSVCRGGACADQVCTPGTRTCRSGDAYACNEAGIGFELADRCNAPETCEDGVCVGGDAECVGAGDCPPLATRCDGNTLVEYVRNGTCTRGSCLYGGAIAETNCGDDGRICNAATQRCESTGGGSCLFTSDCPRDQICVGGSCVECGSTGDCGPDEVCVGGSCEPCDCPRGFVCTAAGGCIDGDPDACVTDDDCVDLAVALGYSGNGALCDRDLGCFTDGACGASDAAFGSGCPDGLACAADLLLGNTCSGCVVDGDCRAGERCNPPVFPLPGLGSYCASSGTTFP